MTIDVPDLDMERMVVLSLKPRFAEAILAGVKTVELRRTEPKIVVPTRALLYASTPLKALVGTCIIESIRSADLTTLWDDYGSRSDLCHCEFLQYFAGVDRGTALTLTQPQALKHQIGLKALRAKPKGFRPPQSYAYIDTETGDEFIGMAA